MLDLQPGRLFSLHVDGPFAASIAGGNLIQRAAERHSNAYALHKRPKAPQAADHIAGTCGAFRLEKQIPVAAGLGGGSADAAAALRLLAGIADNTASHAADEQPPSPSNALFTLLPFARELGADVPVCLFSKPAVMTGVGEHMRFLTDFPAIPILLVNPLLPLSTADVFRELRANPLRGPADRPAPQVALRTIDDVVRYAAARSNDLEAPARRLLPVIGVILEALASCPGALLARLSGSGPTCFALFGTENEAEAAALQLSQAHPEWWIKPTVLG